MIDQLATFTYAPKVKSSCGSLRASFNHCYNLLSLRFRRCRCVRDCLTPHPCRKVFKLEP
ncbi:hypothetical protein I7I53_05397 [Histoplasma capsulatum var. duboisii H88]|uniref:Uncharacterized protein n=1 Tax=Ajellomyces capsulatus (strain H88) TaxID=544711 RepID=A0A8A1LSH8_AJEC8|nr:hypothetical protein I7I53_05397 [Histoplasma capsulatum var. duboisii H88]